MKWTIRILAVLLVAQIALAVGLNYRGSEVSPGAAKVALLDVAKDRIDRVTIEGPDGEKVVLAHTKDGWQLPDRGNFPANGDKVDGMLDKLLAIKEGLPVATSKGALERFSLSDDKFERRMTFANGDQTLATLYFGTTQGARQVHARHSDQDAVYTVTFGTYEAPSYGDDWLDKKILQFPETDIAAIDVDGLRLIPVATDKAAAGDKTETDKTATPAKPTWRLAEDTGGPPLNVAAADKLAGRIAALRIDSVLGTEAKPEYGLDAPVVSLSVARKDGDSDDYVLGKAADKDDYTLKVSSRPEYFHLTGYEAKGLIDAAARDALLEIPSKKNDETASKT
jgi:hypothetical protein